MTDNTLFSIMPILAEVKSLIASAESSLISAQSILDQLVGDNIGAEAISPYLSQFSIFIMAVFVGYYVVWSVTPALHTPLMSITNAISSVIIVGAIAAVGANLLHSSPEFFLARGFGFVAIVLASINIFGGFWVTRRMLAMYRKKSY